MQISKPHPRKGTETVQNLYINILLSHDISKPHPRKGTETCNQDVQQEHCLTISKPHPRKGTETVAQQPQ